MHAFSGIDFRRQADIGENHRRSVAEVGGVTKLRAGALIPKTTDAVRGRGSVPARRVRSLRSARPGKANPVLRPLSGDGGVSQTLTEIGAMKSNDELLVIDVDTVKTRMFTIRGQQVLLDRDVAALYGVET